MRKFWKKKLKLTPEQLKLLDEEIIKQTDRQVVYFKKGDDLHKKAAEAASLCGLYGWSYLIFLSRESED